MDRRVADDAVVRAAPAGLELRLHERDDLPRRGAAWTRPAPRTLPSEMNETSIVARAMGSGSVADVSVRAFVRSIETTRGSRRSVSASWPRPTSRA